MVNSVQGSQAGSPQYETGAVTSMNGKSLGQTDFLRLMVAQIKNQDPLEPKTNGDFLAQLAQFSINDGVKNMQQSLSQSLQSNQALQASALVGRKVMFFSDQVKLGKEGEAKAQVNVPAGVNNLTASVYSRDGQLIKKIPLGQPETGIQDFSWDGTNDKNVRVAEGDYYVRVSANYQGQEVPLQTVMTANVDSVSLGSGGEGIRLNVAGVGSIPLNQVLEIKV